MTNDHANTFYLGRQPIVDRDQQLIGFELLFRNCSDNAANFDNAQQATAQVVANAFVELAIDDALGQLLAFLNVDAVFLASDAIEALPPARCVLEILETITATADIVARCESLKAAGFRFALDDLCRTDDPRLPLLPLIDIVKIDLILVSAAELPALVAHLRAQGQAKLQLLAEKIDTHDDLVRCQSLGFDQYQGYHFARPAVITGRKLDSAKVVLLKLLSQIIEDADTPVLENSFKQAPGLTINLLRLVNSVATGMRVRITSLRHAITVLGRRQLQRWLQLLLYTDPHGAARLSNPLLQLAATRGRLMERLAERVAHHDDRLADQSFMVGVMSLTPVLFDLPLEKILAQVNLAGPVCDALSEHKGRLGHLLRLIETMETDDPAALHTALLSLPMLKPSALSADLTEALRWANRIGQEHPADD